MLNDGQSAQDGSASMSPESRKEQNSAGGEKKGRGRYPDMQSAVRFPIKLPVEVHSNAGDSRAETQNISANGVLFQVESEMPVGSMVDFTISLPADVVGAEADVKLDCRGRVVRNYEEAGRRGVGVVIDEYRFERREER
jgi:hypothetical protein